MPSVWVSVGSNIERERHIRSALDALRALFGELIVSPLYETPAVGFVGDPFYNLVVGFYTELPPARLHGLLREIETRNARRRDGVRFGPRTLDLDLLTYGATATEDGGKPLPRDEILRYAFVLAPLADVAGTERHPALGRSYRELWNGFPASDRHGLKRLSRPDWLVGDAA